LEPLFPGQLADEPFHNGAGLGARRGSDRISAEESHIRLRAGPNVHHGPESLANGPKKKMKKDVFSFDIRAVLIENSRNGCGA
jgi:hypothetical protein